MEVPVAVCRRPKRVRLGAQAPSVVPGEFAFLAKACNAAFSTVRFATMPDAANFNGVSVGTDKEEPVISHSQAQFFSSLQGLHITRTRFCETVQRI